MAAGGRVAAGWSLVTVEASHVVAPPRGRRVGLITQRDLAMVAWLGRFPFLTIDLLQRWITDLVGGGSAVSVVYARLRVLEAAELVSSARVLADAGRAVWVTPEGLRTAGLPGRSRPPRVSSFHHDLAVARLATSIAVDKPSHTLVTEREMRHFDTPPPGPADPGAGSAPEYATPKPGGKDRERIYPDLITVAPTGRRTVHEVEMSPKEHTRLRSLMVAHLSNERNASARYYASSSVLRRVEAAAAAAREVLAERGVVAPLTVVEL